MNIRVGIVPFAALFLLAGATFAQAPQPPALDKLIDRYADAIGGREAWSRVDYLEMRGSFVYRGVTSAMRMEIRRNNTCRLVLGEGEWTLELAYDGKQGWEAAAGRGVKRRAVEDPEDANSLAMLAVLPDAVLAGESTGLRLESAGSEKFDGEWFHRVNVRLPSGRQEQWYFDPDSFLLSRRTSRFRTDDGEAVQTIFYLDYAATGELRLARYLERAEYHYVRGFEIESVTAHPASRQ